METQKIHWAFWKHDLWHGAECDVQASETGSGWEATWAGLKGEGSKSLSWKLGRDMLDGENPEQEGGCR